MAVRLTMDELLVKKKEAEAMVAAIDVQIGDRLKETLVMCSPDSNGRGCSAGAMIKDVVYQQSFWYVPPRGCSEGDYWQAGEGRWVCNHCKKVNRLYDKPEIMKLSMHFKRIEEVHDK